jgi:hypothetical protein
MVGTPVVVVTSYILYQRGKAQPKCFFLGPSERMLRITVVNGEEPRPFDMLLKGGSSISDRSEDG